MSLVASPCTGVCRVDPVSGWCEGCHRTIDEIMRWSSLGDLDKRRIWKLLPARRAARADAGSGTDRPEPT